MRKPVTWNSNPENRQLPLCSQGSLHVSIMQEPFWLNPGQQYNRDASQCQSQPFPSRQLLHTQHHGNNQSDNKTQIGNGYYNTGIPSGQGRKQCVDDQERAGSGIGWHLDYIAVPGLTRMVPALC